MMGVRLLQQNPAPDDLFDGISFQAVLVEWVANDEMDTRASI